MKSYLSNIQVLSIIMNTISAIAANSAIPSNIAPIIIKAIEEILGITNKIIPIIPLIHMMN